MNKDMKKKYNLIAKISGVVIGLVLVLGISYAVFRTTTMGDKDNVVNAGKLDVRVENEKDEITIPNALPQTEEQGKSSTPYTFDIVNEGTIDAMYDLYIELSDDTTLKDNDIRYYLTKTVDGTETPIDDKTSHYLSDALDTEKKEKKLYRIDINDELKTKDKVSYKLYLWIDYDATADEATNKVFKGVIRVDASQLVERNETLLRKVDVSENSDGSAYAYVYDDGTLKIKGTGNLVSGIDDMDIYASNPSKVLKGYKKVLSSMGYDVSNITTMEELQTFKEEQSASDSNFESNFEIQKYITSYKETLKEMGYTDTDTITDIDSVESYVIEKGLMDSSGNLSTEGEEFLTRAEAKYNSAYAETVSITNIEIDEGITNIPEGIYTGNSDITSVTIPSSVTSIGDKAFYGCTNLTTISIPSTVTSIGKAAFNRCTSLTTIDLPSGLKTIEDSMFYYCTSLTSITIPNSVTSIGNWAFDGCTSLTSITIPNSVIKMGENSFRNCTSLSKTNYTGTIDEWVSINFGFNFDYSNPIYYSKNLYINDELVEDVTIDKDIKSYALYNLQSLKSVTLTDNVTSIGSDAFKNCIGLTSITIPNSVTNIGGSFDGCTNLTKLSIDGTKDYGDIGAPNITDLTITGIGDMYDYGYQTSVGGSSIKYYKTWYSSASKIKNVTISDTITGIGEFAFTDCTALTSVTIPSSVTSIGSVAAAFSGCTSLTAINVDENNENYSSTDGVLFNKDQTTLIFYSKGKQDSTYTVPSTVTRIENYAFSSCTGLTSITIPNSVTYIGTSAFSSWSSSQTINIDNTSSATSKFDSNWKTGCNATINYLRT